jgi:hypothetical protein
MKCITGWLMLALFFGTVAHAADKAATTVIRDYTDSVAPADQKAYEDGVKSFNQCLHQHGFKYTWTAWTHETGDTYSYSYTSEPLSWGSFDDMDSSAKDCDAIFKSSVNPHLKSETSAFLQNMPELSHMPKDAAATSPFIEVTYFTLKYGHEASDTFVATAKKIAAAADKSKWPYYFMIGRLHDAGEGAPDFILVVYAKSWAEVGADPDPDVWTMVANVYGKSDAAAMRKAVNDVIKDESSHVDSYNADLTYSAPRK